MAIQISDLGNQEFLRVQSTVHTLIDWVLETLKAEEFVVKKTHKIELESQGHE